MTLLEGFLTHAAVGGLPEHGLGEGEGGAALGLCCPPVLAANHGFGFLIVKIVCNKIARNCASSRGKHLQPTKTQDASCSLGLHKGCAHANI